MKALTVQEASQNLGELVQSAIEGEEITIQDGAFAVLLQPVRTSSPNRPKGREALRQLQSQSQLTSVLAERYLQEIQGEHLAQENSGGR